ncbi:MAG: ectoine synthase [Acidimicrobiales bacterium]
MIIRHLNDTEGTDRWVEGPTFVSRRLLLADDQVGFSFHDTILYAGSTTRMWYANHIEAVYCIEGKGVLEDLVNGETHEVTPGMLYTLNGHEKHVLHATTQLRMVCVFNPPLTGGELHDENGTYPLLTAEG